MKRYFSHPIVYISIILLNGFYSFSQDSTPTPINADPTIIPESLSELEAITSPSELWNRLNNLGYWQIPLEAPDDYYSSVNLSNHEKMRESLHNLISPHTVYDYSTSSRPGDNNHIVDVWDIIILADAHPEFPDHVLDLYFNDIFIRQYAGTQLSHHYDREHSWPKSFGFKYDNKINPAYSDCHHLFAAYQPYNSSRSNKPYGNDGENPPLDDKRVTVLNVNRGGDEGDDANYSTSGSWETWNGRRGDVARAMFYMELRYDGFKNDNRKEADLQLTNDLEKVVINNDAWKDKNIAYMGKLDDLLKWHKEDPVDDLERRRNTVVYLFQHNRNPFIDHPEWVDVIYSNLPIESPTETMVSVWINEFHYDNIGADQDEFVEIAGTAGTDLTGWKIAGYNGSNGLEYNSITLSGPIDDEGNGFGAVSFNFAGLQNGAPDGIALISNTGEVVQFISYEAGGFTAGDGPAVDEASDPIDQYETGETPVGSSLQLQGTGIKYKDFQWQTPAAASPGSLNGEQIINR